jgi:predicted NAD/FAD-dependent oxidoreductase
MAGAAACRVLADHGIAFEVFEKSRGWGGRMSTKKISTERGIFYFDHGAQYFTTRDERFQRLIHPLVKNGTVSGFEAKWNIPKEVSHCEETPQDKLLSHNQPLFSDTKRYWVRGGMNGLCKEVANKVTITQRKVTSIRSSAAYTNEQVVDVDYVGKNGYDSKSSFAAVISTVPLPQLVSFMDPALLAGDWVQESHWTPCFAIMLGFKNRDVNSCLPQPANAGFVSDGLGGEHWFCDQSERFYPHGSPLSSWVVHASKEFSNKHFEYDKEEVKDLLLDQLADVVEPLIQSELVVSTVHRWRFSKPGLNIRVPEKQTTALREQGIFLAGDGLSGGRVEGAYISGLEVAEDVCRYLSEEGIG